MMKQNELRIGVIFADMDEYLPFEEKALAGGGEKCSFFSRPACKLKINNDGSDCIVTAVNCGIGKVNATAAAMYLAPMSDVLFSIGYSGGISGVRRGQLVVGERFLEHDFDLTCIGYDFAEKPGQAYIYDADIKLRNILCESLNLKSGVFVTGDCFVSNDELRNILKTRFSAMACDMETAAEAYVSELYGIPFASVRRISDDAGDSAVGDYREMNECEGEQLAQVTFRCLEAIIKNFGRGV